MERRTFLKSGSLGIAAVLAGCNGGDQGQDNGAPATGNGSGSNGSNSASTGTANGAPTGTESTSTSESAEAPETTQSGPAAFADATIGGPTNVTVGEEFELPVSVANTGGQNGTFSGTLTVAEGSSSFNRSVTIEGVEPGGTGNSTVGPLNITSADNYTLALKGSDTTHTLQVAPAQQQPGKAVTAKNVKVTVRNLLFTPALFHSLGTYSTNTSPDTKGLLSASSEKILCVIELTLENVGTNQAEFTIPDLYNSNSSGVLSDNSGPPPMLTLPKGSFYTELPNASVSLEEVEGVKGSPLNSVQLSAGQTKSGWLVAQLPRSAASKAVEVGLQGDAKGTPPEAIWEFAPKGGSTRQLPNFTLQKFNVPSKVPLGSQKSYTIQVKNTGDAAGMYRGITELNGPDSNDWAPFAKQKAQIPPGQSKTFTHQINVPDPALGQAQFRLQPYGKTASLTFNTVKLSLGNTFAGPQGRAVTVSDLQQADSYQTADSDDPITADQGQHYILARIGVKFTSQDAGAVNTFDVNLVSGGSTYDPASEYADRFTNPVQADVVTGDLTGPKGSAKSGYIVYQVPRSVTPSNSKIVWSADTPWAQWQ